MVDLYKARKYGRVVAVYGASYLTAMITGASMAWSIRAFKEDNLESCVAYDVFAILAGIATIFLNREAKRMHKELR